MCLAYNWTAHNRCFWTFRTEDSITDEDKRRYVCCRSWCHVSDFGHSAWMSPTLAQGWRHRFRQVGYLWGHVIWKGRISAVTQQACALSWDCGSVPSVPFPEPNWLPLLAFARLVRLTLPQVHSALLCIPGLSVSVSLSHSLSLWGSDFWIFTLPNTTGISEFVW